jgi:GntR family negative regulator for fad regulon and positive regulator of fabA
MEWTSPKKPAELTEERLIQAILNGKFPLDSNLPGERELAVQLGVTRPTLREALQRMARDGWVEINHGKPTRVCNYLQEGNLAVLAVLVRQQGNMPDNFVRALLQVRELLAPAYSQAAIENAPEEVLAVLEECLALEDTPEDFALADWKLHHRLTVCSGNPVFTLILNGFQDLYPVMGEIYFQNPEARAASREFYTKLQRSILLEDEILANEVTKQAMEVSVSLWQKELKG